jgi:hypothetical protein
MSAPSERGAAREEVRRNQQCWPPNLQCGLRHAMISARRVQQVLNACNLAVDLGELRFSEFHSLRVLEHSGTLKHCSPSLPHTLPHTQCTLERCIEVDRRSLASATFHGWCSLRSGSKRLSRKGAVTPNRYIASCPSGARERTPWSSPAHVSLLIVAGKHERGVAAVNPGSPFHVVLEVLASSRAWKSIAASGSAELRCR